MWQDHVNLPLRYHVQEFAAFVLIEMEDKL